MSVQADSLVIPLTVDGHGLAQMHDAAVRVEAIDAAKKKGEKASATVTVSYYLDQVVTTRTVFEATIQEGDVVLLRKAAHKVRKVVPADAKTRVIGWLELPPDSATEVDLIKKKIDFVRPTTNRKPKEK